MPKQLVVLFLLAGACTVGTTNEALDTDRLRNGANADSAECAACAAEVEQCLTDGGDCIDMYFECERVCLDPADQDDPADPADPADPCGSCEADLDPCLDAAGDNLDARDQCWEQADQCWADCDPQQGGDGDCLACEDGYFECLDNGTGEDECAIQADDCLLQCHGDQGDPSCDSCDGELEQCLDQAGDDWDAQDQCWLDHGDCCVDACA